MRRSFFATIVVLMGFGASLSAEEPLHRYQMILALDSSFESQWLRREIERDWTRPNPAIVLTPEQQTEVRVRGSALNAVMVRLRQKFIVTIVNECPTGIRMPAIRIGGKWESIDRRAFVKETDPLLTLEWYHHEHDWVVGRLEGEGDWKRYWYIGPRPYPPWLADAVHDTQMYQDGVRLRAYREDGGEKGGAPLMGDQQSTSCLPPSRNLERFLKKPSNHRFLGNVAKVAPRSRASVTSTERT